MQPHLNPNLTLLHPYPFERLRILLGSVAAPASLTSINLSIGEPKHPTPAFIKEAFAQGAESLSNYPTTMGSPSLREAVKAWLTSRHGLSHLDASSQVLPILGSREALFSLAQCVIDSSRGNATVVIPNPFYQIYEGACLLAGATPYYYSQVAQHHYRPRWETIPPEVWQRTQLVYVCSPDNPSGRVLTLSGWREIFNLSARYGFVIASDECYSEVHFNEDNPPLGAMAAAQEVGNPNYERLLVFGSLSKRSNVPGLRSGFVAGDAELIKAFLLYRTYHGSAMSPAVAAASTAAWQDEAHARENRYLYARKFNQLTPMLNSVLPVDVPEAAFYWWLPTPISDVEFAQRLYREQSVKVLPGSFLARDWQGHNPGSNFVRVALVAPFQECEEAVGRMIEFCRAL